MNKSLQDKVDWAIVKTIIYGVIIFFFFALWIKFSAAIFLVVVIVVLKIYWDTGGNIELERVVEFLREPREDIKNTERNWSMGATLKYLEEYLSRFQNKLPDKKSADCNKNVIDINEGRKIKTEKQKQKVAK